MGCDGGTIPKRDELVRTKKKKETSSKDCQNAAKWNYCHLSQLPLQKPIVADMLGNLYNKDSIIEYLLDKSKFEKAPESIKTLKDVKELKLEPNPNYNPNRQETDANSSTLNKAQWICPITGLEMSGTFKFYYLHSCGCVFSERAYKSISNATSKCLKCDKPFSENDLFVLNPNDDDLKSNEAKMKARKEKSKSEKSNKTSATTSTASSSASVASSSSTPATTSKQVKENGVKHDDSHKSVKRPIDAAESNGKKVKSVQDDPNVSDVYKSLFTSSEKAKNQTKAHWVTFNPQYF